MWSGYAVRRVRARVRMLRTGPDPKNPMRTSYPATPEAVPRARHAVSAHAREVGIDEPTLTNIAIALTEACANVVLHAYRDRDEPGFITLVAECDGNEFVVVVADSGTGLKPRVDSPGLGVGLSMIRKLADQFDIRTSRAGGTEVRMRFAAA